MIVTPALLSQLFVTFSAAFKEGFGLANPAWNQVAMLVKSNSAANTYAWLGQFPQFREWIGDRSLKDLKAHAYQLVNKNYESTVQVGRTEIEDDSVGTFSPIFAEMGRAAASFPDKLVFDVMNAAFASLCYDGQFFFDTDHPVAANVDGTGAVTSTSNFGGGAGTPWFLLDTSRAIKPFILQERKAAEFVAMTRSDDEKVFTSNAYRYGVDGRWNAGYGLWQLAYASRQTLTAAAFDVAIDAMAAFKADGGRPMGVMPTVLVVPTALRVQAEAILLKDRLANGEANTNFKRLQLVVTPWLNA